jgi:hypothetical protein
MREVTIKTLQAIADHLYLLQFAVTERTQIIKHCNLQISNLTGTVNGWSIEERKAFVRDDEVAILLYKIYDALIGETAKVYHKSLIQTSRSKVDQLFNVLNVKAPATYFNYLPTRIFTEICKGITYFEGDATPDTIGRPTYHRPTSCGSKRMTFKEKFEVPKDATATQTRAIQQATRLCYLERLIYDKIFFQVLHYQDVRHAQELKNMERLFQDYYPGEKIVVEVDLEGSCVVKITTSKNESNVIETYIKKKWNAQTVDCLKEMVVSTNVRGWTKQQSFEKLMPWVPANWEVRSASRGSAARMARRGIASWGGK